MLKFLLPGEGMDMRRHFALLALCWSVIMLIAMAYAMNEEFQKRMDFAELEARIAFDKDVIYRKWNAIHGGVYAEITGNTTPNPYLKNAFERDILTPSGRKLTLINPAYMTRQVQALERQKRTRSKVVTHITSLNPLNPVNAPDPWEKKALMAFQKGKREFIEKVEINGRPFLRFMKPFYVETACLKCHGHEGCRLGQTRGGISVKVALEGVNSLEKKNLLMSWAAYFALWLMGLAGLAVGTWRMDQFIKAMRFTEEELQSFKVTLDGISDAILMFRPDSCRFFYVNNSALKLLGYNRAELLLMTPADVGLCEGNCMEFLRPLMEAREDVLQVHGDIVNKDGNAVPVSVKIQLMECGRRGKFFVAIIRDLSNRIAMEKEQERLAAELLHAQKLEAVGRLAAGIAHEINTPTQYVGTNIDFLDEAFQDLMELQDINTSLVQKAEQEKFHVELVDEIRTVTEQIDLDYLREEIPGAIEESRDGIKRVTSIVRAMKEFSHPGSREKEPADINKLVETTATIARNEWKYVSEVKLDLAPDIPAVPCLSDEMNQVILNMIVNAAQAIEEKLGDNPEGEKGVISIKTRTDGNWVELRISDTGTGMSEEIQPMIFEPFFTTKEVGRGSGQGLAIARNVVVEKHGGTIEVESEPGKGTTFIIRLPIG